MSRSAWLAMGAALGCWTGALAATVLGLTVLLVAAALSCALAAGLAIQRRTLAAMVVGGAVLGMASGLVAQVASRPVPLPVGAVELVMRVVSDPEAYFESHRFVATPQQIADGNVWRSWSGPSLEVLSDETSSLHAGDIVSVEGYLTDRPGRVRSHAVAGRLIVTEAPTNLGAANPAVLAANTVRDRVVGGLDRTDRAQALLAGFLIGDTSGVSRVDQDTLRLAGLSHFVAVSGSNVGLFLIGWWLVLGPLALRPRRRALFGIVGVVLFVLITRSEPSVLRAGTMATLVLVGRLVGVHLDAWTALGLTIVAVLTAAGGLATDVAFQLSVGATVGVMLAVRVPPATGGRMRRWLTAATTATLFAQALVAPLLVLHFGAIPVLSPVANVLAAPLVVVATALGWPAALVGSTWLVGVASFPAALVLQIAEVASGWPQLGIAGVGLLMAFALAITKSALRPLVIGGFALVAGWATFAVGGPPEQPTVVFLDVGQGDATLLLDPGGAVVLVDGGREPSVLAGALRRHGINRIDLLIISHGDADHVGGLTYLSNRVPVGTVWHPRYQQADLMNDVLEELAAAGSQIKQPDVGWSVVLGGMSVEVVGPLRRYASENDGSIVLLAGTRSIPGYVLLTADIEAVAQRELGPQTVPIFKVPHHGSATTDLAWLSQVDASVAVVSVGSNTFGHPNGAVIDLLVESGATVKRTDIAGDVAIPMPGG